MKKVLSIVLVLAMILGSFSMVFATAATTYTDVAGKDCEEAVAVLTGLGVVEGYKATNTFKPEAGVTRAQMVKLIIAALALPVEGAAKTQFADVPETHWASAYVYYATKLGIVEGYSATKFGPDDPVTYDQAITMVMRALGYTEESLNGTYPTCFVNQAVALGVLDGVQSGSAKANRGDMAQLIYNVLRCAIGKVDAENEWNPDKSGDTMLKRLGCDEFVKENNNNVADVMGTEDGYQFVVTDQKSVIDLDDYVGHVVTAYKNKDGKIVSIDKVYTTKLEAAEWDAKKETLGGYKISKLVTNDAVLFLNGEENGTKTYNSTASTYTGYTDDYDLFVTLDGNYLEKVYAAAQWTNAKTFQVTEKNVKDFAKDNTKFAGHYFDMTSKDEIDYDVLQMVGADAVEDVKKDDVVTVYLRKGANSDSATNYVVKMEVCDTVVEGKVEKMNSDKEYFVDGEGYKKVTGYASVDFKVGDEVKLYLNYAGKIFAAEIVEGTSDELYGLLLAVRDGSEAFDASKNAMARIYTAEGKTVDYVVNKAAADTNADITVTNDIVTFDDDTSSDDFYDLTFNGSVAPDKDDFELVEYKLNKDGEVASLVFAYDDWTEAVKKNGVATAYGTGTECIFDEDTVIFTFDSTEEKYGITTVKSVLDTDDTNDYDYIDFAVNADDEVVAAVVWNPTTTTVDDDTYVVLYAYEEYEDAYKLYGLADGEKVVLTTDDNFVVSSVTGAHLNKVTYTDGLVSGLTAFTPTNYTCFRFGTEESEIKDLNGVKTLVAEDKFILADDYVIYVYDVDKKEWVAGDDDDLAGFTSDDNPSGTPNTMSYNRNAKVRLFDYEYTDPSKEGYNEFDIILVMPDGQPTALQAL